MEYQTPEEKDFIVDDGYKHDEDSISISLLKILIKKYEEDPTYIPDKYKNVFIDKDFDNLTNISIRVIKRLIKMYTYSNNEEVLDYINSEEVLDYINRIDSRLFRDMIGEGKYLLRKKFGLEANYKIGVLPFVEEDLKEIFGSNYDIVDFCIRIFLYDKAICDCDINNYHDIFLEIIKKFM